MAKHGKSLADPEIKSDASGMVRGFSRLEDSGGLGVLSVTQGPAHRALIWACLSSVSAATNNFEKTPVRGDGRGLR